MALDAIVYNGTDAGCLEVKVQPQSGAEIWLLAQFPDAARREYQPTDENYGKGCYYIVPKTKEVIHTLFMARCPFSDTALYESLRLFMLYWTEQSNPMATYNS